MADNSLKILIQGQLDEASTVSSINTQLKELGKKLNVTIGVNGAELDALAKKVGDLQDKINKNQTSIVSSDETKKLRTLETSIQEIINKQKELGEVTYKTSFNPLTNQVEKLDVTLERANGEVKKLKYELASLKGLEVQGKNPYVLTNEQTLDKSTSIREKQLRQEQAINNQLEKQEKQRNKEIADLEHTIKLYQERSNIQVSGLVDRYKNNIDSKALEEYRNNVKGITAETPDARKRMEELSLAYKNIATNARIASKDSIDLGDALNQAFTKFPIWMAVSTAFFMPLQIMNQFVDTLYILDDQLVSINKVMENADLSKVFTDATEAAYTYGQTIDQTLKSIEEISKLGFNQEDATALSNNAMLLSTVGEFKGADAANYLVAIMRQYRMEISETAKVVDSLNEVSNKTGADTVDLAQGLSKASASADVAGVTFDELNGMLSSTVESLKISGNEAGTFYKSMFTRLLRSDTQKSIEAIGVAVNDMTGQMKPATQILADLSDKFDSLSATQKSALAEDLGGMWHANKVINLLQQQDQVLKNTESSMYSYGSAAKELQGFSEGLTFKTNVMKASFQELAQTLGETGARDVLVSLIEMTTTLTRGFTEVTEATDGWNLKLPILIGLIYGGAKALGVLRLALTGVKSSFGVFALGIVAIEALSAAIAGTVKSTESFTDSQEKSIQALTSNKSETDELISSYKEMSEAREKAGNSWSVEKEEEFLRIQQELGSVFPGLIESIDSQGRYHLVTTEKIQEQIDATEKLIDSKKRLTILEAEDTVNDTQDEINQIKEEIKYLEDKKKTYEGIAKTSPFEWQGNDASIKAEQKTAEILSLQSDLAVMSQKINADIADITDAFNNIQIDPKIKTQISDIISSMDLSKVSGTEAKNIAKNVSDSMGEIQKAIESGSQKSLNSAVTAFNEYIDKISDSDPAVASLTISMNDLEKANEDSAEANDILTDSIEGVTSAQEEKLTLSQQLIGLSDKELSSTRELIALYSSLASQENLSVQQKETLRATYEQLAAIYPHLASNGKLHIEAMQKEAEQSDILIQAIEKMADGQLSAEETMTLNAAIGVKNRISLLKDMINAYKQASDALYQMAQQQEQSGWDGTRNEMTAWKFGHEGLQMESDILSDVTAKLDDYVNNLSNAVDYNGQYYKSEEAKKKELEKSNKETERSTYVSDKYKLSLEQIQTELAKINSVKSKYPQHSKEYRKALQREIDLLNEQQNIYSKQAKDLSSQIKSGNIRQTGIVKTSSASTSSTPSSTSTMATGSSTQATIWNYFKSKGFSDGIVAGIMGNLQLESGFSTTATNKSSGAYGLAQWLGGRKSSLSNFAASRGTSMSDLQTQLDFLWKELNGSERRTLNWIQGNPNASASQMAAMFDKLFERSEGTHIPQRQSYANAIYSQFSGKSVPTTYVSTTSVSDATQAEAERLQAIDNAKSQLLSIQQESASIADQIQELYMEIVNSQLEAYDKAQEAFNDDLAYLDLQQNRLNQNSEVWYEKQLEREKILREQIKLEEQSIKYIKEQIKQNTNLSAAQKDILNDEVINRVAELRNLEQEILSERIEMADQVVDTYKQAIEAQKTAQLDAIDKIIEEIDKTASDSEYKRKLEDAQKDRQEILDEIAKLSLDDSASAQKRIAELNEQLKDSDDSIYDMQNQNSIDERKENLEAQRESIEERYENLLNDERKFGEMRSSIINGNTSQIKKDLQKFYDEIKKNTNVLGQSISNNLIDLINQASYYLNGKDYKPIKIASLDSGGYTGAFGSQGKLAMLHEKEIVLNKSDTSNFLKAIDITRNFFSNMKIPDISKLSLKSPSASGGNTYNLSLNIDNMNGTKTEARSFATELVTGLKTLGVDI